MDEIISEMLIVRASELIGVDLRPILRGKTFRDLYINVEQEILLAFYRCKELRDALPSEMIE